jgi:hypothetical protein
MKKNTFIGIVLTIALGFMFQNNNLYAQHHMGRGMMGYEQDVSIPDKLPKPKSEEWLDKLIKILAQEHLSQAQYDADRKKYQVNMPYMMVIPQEGDHIEWIKKLFSAYGLKHDVKKLSIKETKTLTQAYEDARELE